MKFVNRTKYTSDQSKITSIRPSHVEYLTKLADQGKVVLSGPAEGGGMTVFEVETKEEAEKLIQADPFFIEGVVVSNEVFTWDIKISSL